MADITLTVGIDESLSLTEFKNGINNIVSKINGDPPKIKIQLDNKSVDAMRKQAEGIAKAQSKASEATTLSLGSTRQLNALRQVNSELTRVTINTQKWTAAQRGSSSGSYAIYSQQADALRNLAAELETGDMKAKDFANRFAEIRLAITQSSGAIKIAGEDTSMLGFRFGDLAAKAINFIGKYRIIMTTIRTFKEMANIAMDIESSMAQIQVVTGATDSELQNFFQSSTRLAKELGQNITDVAKSIEVFSRLGYSLNDATQLAEYANVLSNVADTDVNAATTGLTSIIKGFNMQVSDAEHVTDVLTQVGQKYAISAEELMEAFERGGASMAASGTSFEQTAALFAATNASLQNASTVGTLWKTVSARIRGAKTELEEMGEDTSDLADGFSKYRQELIALTGVDIQLDSTHYKDMLTIFTELASVWDNLESDMARSRVAEILGGTRNQSGIMSTILNIKDAIGAYDDAMNSAGVAMNANEIVMDTTAKHVEQLKIAFQEMSVNFMNSDVMKFFVDIGTGILNIINKLGGLKTAIAGIGVAALIKDFGGLRTIIGQIFSSKSIGDLAAGFKLLGEGIGSIITSSGAMALGVAAGIAAIVAAYRYLDGEGERADKKMEDAYSAYDASKSKVEELKGQLEDVASQMDDLSLKKGLTPIEKEQLDDLREATELLQTQADLAEKEEKKAAKKAAKDTETAFAKNFGEVGSWFETGKDFSYSNIYEYAKNNMLQAEVYDKDNSNNLVNAISSYMIAQANNDEEEMERISELTFSQLDHLTGYREKLESLPYDELTSEQQELLANIVSVSDLVYQVMDPHKWDEIQFDRIYKSAEHAPTVQGLVDIAKARGALSVEDISELAPELTNRFVEEGIALRTLADAINSDAGLIDEQQAVSQAVRNYNKLNKGADLIVEPEAGVAEALKGINEEIKEETEEASDEDIVIYKDVDVEIGKENTEDTFTDFYNALTDEYKKVVLEMQENGFDFSALGGSDEFETALLDWVKGSDEVVEEAVDLTVESLQDKNGDFQKAIAEYTSNLDTLQSSIEKYKNGELSDKDIFDLKNQFPELRKFTNFGKGLESVFSSTLDSVNTYINGIKDQTHKLNIKKYLGSVWSDIKNIYDPKEADGIKGTIEDFYDLLKNDEFTKGIEGVTSNIDKVKSAMDSLENGEYSKSKFYKDFVGQFPGMEQYVDNMDEGLEELFNQLMNGGPLVGEAGSLTELFNAQIDLLSQKSPEAAAALQGYLDVIKESYTETEEATSAIDSLKDSLAGFSTYQGNVSKALSASTSAIGLTTDEISNLVDAYKDIEGFDAAKLFQSTGEGVRINAEELERLNSIIERNTLTDLYHNLAEARQKLADAQASGDDTAALENDIAVAQALIAQYEGMTSAYNAWLQAKSAGGERDSYEAIGKAYEEMEKIYNAGWYDDPALQEYLNLLLGDNRTGNAVEDWSRLSATIGDTGKSLMDFWQYGEDGELVTDGLFDLLDVIHDYDNSIVEAGEDGEYAFNLTGDNIQRVANFLGTSPEMVRRYARALDDVGNVTIVGSIVDDLETAQNAVDRIGEIIGEATAQNPEIDIKTVVENSDEIQTLAQQIAELPPEVQTEIGVETVGDVDGIMEQLSENPESIGVSIEYEGEKQEFDDGNQNVNINYEGYKSSFDPGSQSINVDYIGIKTALDPIHQTVFINEVKQTTQATGTLSRARANGSAYNIANLRRAYANGNVALSQDELALVNELGTESIIRNGNWFLLPRGMHQEALKKGDIILSAAQTKALINTGSAPGHGHAYAYGSLGSAYAESYFGTGLQRRQGSTPSIGSSSSGGDSGGGSNGSSSSSSAEEEAKEAKKESKSIFDWIEVRIARIERRIKNLALIANSTFKTLSVRLGASDKEISKVTKEISIQNRGYKRYMKEANKVGLSKSWRKKVQQGKIDIDTIKDEKLAEKIKDYQNWYEKAIACKDAVKELREQLGELYEEQFNTIATDYENRLSQIEHKTNTYNNAIDNLEAHGYLRTTKYYEQLRSVEHQNLSMLKSERDALNASLRKALASGYIKEGSESYYEMLNQINSVNEAIQKSETAIVEFGNSIREVEWEHFDYLQEQISNITKEAEFLIKLMDDSDLFQDNGQLTNQGLATMGLHAQNYDVYMAQAAKYAAELKKIESDIANDKYNTKLLERRQELLEAQRDSILAAEDEKQAIRDMVEEGINTELDALQKLIDKYNDALDSAKDLNDYQKKVRDQAGEVAKLQKQLSAYSGDTSEENRARLQKLQSDLRNAQESLQETEQDRYISEQKKLFSNLYDEYETTLNKRLDNVDQLIKDMMEKVDANGNTISKTLSEEADAVGYTITQSENSIWGNTGSGFALLSNVNTTISGIAANVAAMVANSNNVASNTVAAVTSGTSTAVTPEEQAAIDAAINAQQVEEQKKRQVLDSIKSGTKRSKTITKKEKDSHHALWEYIVKKYGYAPNNNIYHNIASALGVSVSKSPTKAQKDAILKALKAKGLASGSKRVLSSGAYWTNEDGAETIVRRSDRAVLTRIGSGDRVYNAMASENLWNAANNPGAFIVDSLSKMSKMPHTLTGANIGSINYEINIPIDHVGDYNDFMNHLKNDGQFEKFIQSMTVDRLAGRSKLAKNKFQW